MLQAPVHLGTALGMRGKLHDDARCGALGIEVCIEQLVGHRIEKACSHFPENLHGLRAQALRQAQADSGQILRSTAVARLDDLQHVRVQALARDTVQRQCRHDRRQRLTLGLVAMPQIGRVNALDAHKGLHFLVLGKQCHKGDAAALEHMAQILQQGERGALHQRHRFLGAQMGLGSKALRSHLHQRNQLSGLVDPHHLQGPLDLVEVLFGNPDTRVVHGFQIRDLGCLYVPAVAQQCLDRGFQ